MALRISDAFKSRGREEDYINVNPLQTGGRTYPETRMAVSSYVDGYSVCDWCEGNLCEIGKPPIKSMLEEISGFLGMDASMLTNGCREAKYMVMHSMCSPGDSIVVDGNAHYSSLVAAERAGLKVYEVESSGKPGYVIDPEDYAGVIEEVEKKEGEPPALTLLTHVDGSYGNVVDASRVGQISHEYDIPFLLNAAYSAGRMPVNGGELDADFIACSGHKSWAAGGGNIGLLALKEEYKDRVFRPSESHLNKPLEILGCSSRGAATMALMASLPKVKERVGNWGEEVDKARHLSQILDELGVHPLGETPTRHDLVFYESDVLYEISQTHKKRNYYLYKELKKRGVMGIKPGLTKHFKLSTFRLSQRQVEHVAQAFEDIISEYG